LIDALGPLGVDHIDMPATPARVWETIARARRRTDPTPLRRCYDECRSCEKRETASEPAFGSADAELKGSITARTASSQGSQASSPGRTQKAKGLAASRKRPNASNDGTACRLIEICSLSPSGDWR